MDDIDNLLDQYASLKGVWYWNQPLLEAFSASIKDGPNQPLHAMTFFRLLAEFPSNATMYNPEEVDLWPVRLICFRKKTLALK